MFPWSVERLSHAVDIILVVTFECPGLVERTRRRGIHIVAREVKKEPASRRALVLLVFIPSIQPHSISKMRPFFSGRTFGTSTFSTPFSYLARAEDTSALGPRWNVLQRFWYLLSLLT